MMPRRPLLAAAAALLLAACGKAKPSEPVVIVTPGPVALSPEAAVSLVPWCWEHRDLARYADVLAADFRLVGPVIDSTGVAPPDSVWARDAELVSVNHVFQGGGGHARADAIQVTFDASLVALPDTRPGRAPRWHKVVRTPASAAVTISSGGIPTVLRVRGNATFYVVRGDSAAIPPGSALGPDSTFWWIERWEADTAGVGADHSWMWLRRAFR